MDDLNQYKDEVIRKIVESMATALEKEELTQDSLSEISGFILERIDKIQTQDELMQLISEVSTKWPVFKNLELIEKGQIQEKVEDIASQDVTSLVKSGKLEEAIDLAKKTMEDK